MDLALLGRGFILGFAIAAPVGPIGLLCIQRTLNQGQLIGLVSGLGAATADTLYGAIAAFGLTLVTAFLVEQQFWLGLLGGAFLCYLGVRTLLAPPAAAAAHAEAKGVVGAVYDDLCADGHEPDDDSGLCGDFCGGGVGRRQPWCGIGRVDRAGCLLWLGDLVVFVIGGCGVVAQPDQCPSIRVGESRGRRGHYRFWCLGNLPCVQYGDVTYDQSKLSNCYHSGRRDRQRSGAGHPACALSIAAGAYICGTRCRLGDLSSVRALRCRKTRRLRFAAVTAPSLAPRSHPRHKVEGYSSPDPGAAQTT